MKVDITVADIQSVGVSSSATPVFVLELLAIVQKRCWAWVVEAHLVNVLLGILIASKAKENVFMLLVSLLEYPIVDLHVLWLASIQGILLSNYEAIVTLIVNGHKGRVIARGVVVYLVQLDVFQATACVISCVKMLSDVVLLWVIIHGDGWLWCAHHLLHSYLRFSILLDSYAEILRVKSRRARCLVDVVEEFLRDAILATV